MNVGACDKYGSKTAQHKVRGRGGVGHTKEKGRGEKQTVLLATKVRAKFAGGTVYAFKFFLKLPQSGEIYPKFSLVSNVYFTLRMV